MNLLTVTFKLRLVTLMNYFCLTFTSLQVSRGHFDSIRLCRFECCGHKFKFAVRNMGVRDRECLALERLDATLTWFNNHFVDLTLVR